MRATGAAAWWTCRCHQRRRFAFVTLAGVATLLLGPAIPAAAQSSGSQNKLKAAIVSKIPQFVEWPQDMAGRSSLEVCVHGEDPLRPDLLAFFVNESLGSAPVVVRELGSDADLEGCHVLYVSARIHDDHPELLRKAATRPILTVGDGEHFLDAGGIVQLRLVQGRMRFDVNAVSARHVGLRISSQLLQLAVNVRGGTS